jgi:hypothetical protein
VSIGTILLIILILILVGALPTWGHSRTGAMGRVGVSGGRNLGHPPAEDILAIQRGQALTLPFHGWNRLSDLRSGEKEHTGTENGSVPLLGSELCC